MTPIGKKWLERVQAPEITHGIVLAFCQTVAPLAHGYAPGGKKTNLTPLEASEVYSTFGKRVRDIDGGPLILDTADQGREWLARYAVKRCGMPADLDYRAIIEFRLRGVDISDTGYRPSTAPTYSALWADGRQIAYTPYPWTQGAYDGRREMATWRWLQETPRPTRRSA